MVGSLLVGHEELLTKAAVVTFVATVSSFMLLRKIR
jgi:hypothetical protein